MENFVPPVSRHFNVHLHEIVESNEMGADFALVLSDILQSHAHTLNFEFKPACGNIL